MTDFSPSVDDRTSHRRLLTPVATAGMVVAALFVTFKPVLLAIPFAAAGLFALLRFRYHAILLVMIYLPFEDVVLKYATGPAFTFFKFAAEGTVYLLFASVIVDNLRAGRLWHRTPIDLALVAYLLAVTLSGIWNQVPAFIVILANKNILRFVLLFYVIVHLQIDERSLKRLVSAAFAVWLILALVALLEFSVGSAFEGLIRAEKIQFGTGEIAKNVSALVTMRVSSTMLLYSEYAGYNMIFLMLLFAWLLRAVATRRRLPLIVCLALGVTALALTGARSGWIATYLGLLAILLTARPRLLVPAILVPLVLTIVLYTQYISRVSWKPAQQTSVVDRYLALFKAETRLIQRTGDRGFTYSVTLPKVLSEWPVLGLGPGTIGSEVTGGGSTFVGFYPEFSHEPWLQLPPQGVQWLADSGWVAMVAQSGLAGTIPFMSVFVVIGTLAARRFHQETDEWWRYFALGIVGVVVAGFALNLTMNTLTYRKISSFFWVLSAVLVKRHEQHPLPPQAPGIGSPQEA